MLQIDLLSALLLIGISQGVFLTLTLLTRAQNQRRANRFLGVCVLAITLFMADDLMIHLGVYVRYPAVGYLPWPAAYLIGPTFFWYVRSLLDPTFRFDKTQWGHLIPVLLSVLLMLPFYLLPAAIKRPYLEYLELLWIWQVVLSDIVLELIFVHMGAYISVALYRVWQHRRHRRDFYSYEERTIVDWIYGLAIFYLAAWLVYFIAGTFLEYDTVVWDLLIASVVLGMFTVTFLSMRRPLLFQEPMLANSAIMEERKVVVTLTVEESTTRKYAASSLGDDQANYIQQRLIALMETERPYLEGKLTLPQLADRLNVSSNHLSQVINDRLAKNFFEFVNGYRIEEAKRLLLANRKQTVLDVALEAGFNSKSGFYKSFRQHTDMTPSQFRKSAENIP